jgi:hypothetical protein
MPVRINKSLSKNLNILVCEEINRGSQL